MDGWGDELSEENNVAIETKSVESKVKFWLHFLKWPTAFVAVNLIVVVLSIATQIDTLDRLDYMDYGRYSHREYNEDEEKLAGSIYQQEMAELQHAIMVMVCVWSILLTVDAFMLKRAVAHVQKQMRLLRALNDEEREALDVDNRTSGDSRQGIELGPPNASAVEALPLLAEELNTTTSTPLLPLDSGEGDDRQRLFSNLRYACFKHPPPKLMYARVSVQVDAFLSSGRNMATAEPIAERSTTILANILYFFFALFLSGAFLGWIHFFHLMLQPQALLCGSASNLTQQQPESGRSGIKKSSLLLHDKNVSFGTFSQEVRDFLAVYLDYDYDVRYDRNGGYLELSDHSLYFVGHDTGDEDQRWQAPILTRHTSDGIKTFPEIKNPHHFIAQNDKNGFCFLTQVDPYMDEQEHKGEKHQYEMAKSVFRHASDIPIVYIGCRRISEKNFRFLSISSGIFGDQVIFEGGYWEYRAVAIKFSHDPTDINGNLWLRVEGLYYDMGAETKIRVSALLFIRNQAQEDLVVTRAERHAEVSKVSDREGHYNVYSVNYWWECMIGTTTAGLSVSFLALSVWLWWQEHSPAGSATLICALPLFALPTISCIFMLVWGGVSLWLLVLQRKSQNREKILDSTVSMLKPIIQATVCNRGWLLWSHHTTLSIPVIPLLCFDQYRWQNFNDMIVLVVILGVEWLLNIMYLGYPVLQIAGFVLLALAGLFASVGIFIPPLLLFALLHLVAGVGLIALGGFIQKYRFHIRLLFRQYYMQGKGAFFKTFLPSRTATSSRSA